MEQFTVHSLILVVTTLAIYHNALDCGFVFDDMSAIVENQDLRPNTPLMDLFWNDFWGTPMNKEKSHKSYRPLCVLTFRFNYMLSQLEPMSYHLVNVILHAVVCVLFMKVCGMFVKERTSFLAALLFAVHPVHTEAVTGVVGRAESLSSIFFLAAFLTYSRCTGYRTPIVWRSLVLTVALVTVAMLCKEQGITVIAVCCVYEVFVAQRATFPELLSIVTGLVQGKPRFPGWLKTSIVRAGFLVFSTLFLLFARIKIMGAQLPVFTKFDNPASVSPSPARQLTFNYLLSINAWLLLNPMGLCCDWTMGTVPLITSLADPRNLATLAFYAVVGRLAIFALSEQSQRSRAIIMSLALIVLPFLPASNLFFPVGFVVAERILYTPSLGFCLLVALGFDVLCDSKKYLRFILYSVMTVLLVSHSAKTFVRNYDWTSEYSIFRAALTVNQDNAKLWNNVGHALEKVQKYQEALDYFEKAASIQPDDIGAHINVGRTYVNLNQSAPAEKAYHRAIDLFPPVIKGKSYTARVAPNHLNAYLNLANLVSKDPSRLDEARALLQQAIAMRTDFIDAYINLGDIFVKLDRIPDAQTTYEEAIKIEPRNADLHFNLGVVHLEQKHNVEAKRCFDEALRINPDHTQSLYNSAILMQESGNPNERAEASRRLKKLQQGDPKDPKIYFNTAMLAMDEKQFDLAEVNFRKSIELDPKFRSAMFNLALLLVNDLKRPLDAVPVLEQLLQHYPDHSKGLILMGDINVNVLKNLEAAEQNFVTILKKEPGNVQASHNLCVVYVERGDLLRAEKCLVHTLTLDPAADYVQNHLNIVRSRINQIRMHQQKQQQQQDQKQQQQQQQTQQPKPTEQQQQKVSP
ncbi:protein O-mannosyl-transferase TMTC3-like [Babylonia areolata]|uniref:protein O-mannosyl-transferase TMTC3-like n=1 Tax=Babylonia areolata TaxID=304850 RepID=UPI003FD2FCDD